MKEKLREEIIAISYKQKVLMRISICLILILGVVLIFTDSVTLQFIFWILAIIWLLMMTVFVEIKNSEELIKTNSLINIVLSSTLVWEKFMFWVVLFPIITVLNLEVGVCVGVIFASFIGIIGISMFFSNFFKKRLK